LFGSDLPGLGLARNFGLLLFDMSPAAKRALSRVSWGFAGRMPRLGARIATRMSDYEVAVVGAGPLGCALPCCSRARRASRRRASRSSIGAFPSLSITR
jgi:hypothetical protein